MDLGLEKDDTTEMLSLFINKPVLIQVLLIGFISAFITGMLLQFVASDVMIVALCMIFGLNLGFLGIYMTLISKPLYRGTIQQSKSSDEEEIEFQSTMKME